MILLDSGVLIGIGNRSDPFRKRALEVQKELEDGGESLILTETVLGEVITLLARRLDVKIAVEFARRLIDNEQIEFIQPEIYEIKMALSFMEKYSLRSYADGLSMAVMEARNIQKIASFDSDFDRNPKIKRIK
ncbi:MAG: type II toxin-antitoxin system VapC family toxin [Candidatus Micrarchaeota archaeon]